MVVDPFSIVGTLGLAAGLPGFIVSTVEKTALAASNAKHYSSVLKCHHNSLQADQSRLECHVCWWGHEKSRDIEGIRECIYEQVRRISELLRKPNIPENDVDIKRWRDIQIEQETLQICVPQPLNQDFDTIRLCHRIEGVLWKHALLKESIERLRRLVDDLESLTKTSYHKARGVTDYEGSPTQSDLERIVNLQKRAQGLWISMRKAYTKLNSSTSAWALMLVNTSEQPQDLSSFEVDDELKIYFLHLPSAFRTSAHGRQIITKYHLDLDHERTLQTGCLLIFIFRQPMLNVVLSVRL